MLKSTLITLSGLFLIFTFSFAQRNCATMEVLERLQNEDPDLTNRMNAIESYTEAYVKSGLRQRERVVIPVVVHVVYFSTRENISDAQIQSQIDVLNADFRALNSDINAVPAAFAGVIGDTEIEFCLAEIDPNGNPTNGITRKRGSRSSWGTNDRVKSSASGGTNPWDPSKYLNIWVCNIGNGILGYAQFPGGPAATDGVVVDYRYFGKYGSASYPYNLGRTATHEVGHWLNLRHIWGDATCGSDLVNDTPTHDRANYGCPLYPHYSQCGENIIEMTMNYMDYTEDRCMYMFSAGQAARMQATFAPGGPRASIRNSNGCSASGGNDDGGGDPEPEVCATTTGLSATNITTNGATLNWAAANNAISYDVRLRPIGSATWTTGMTSTTSISATGLNPSTQYEFQVQTNCSSSESEFTSSAIFTTQNEAPGIECNDIFESNNSLTTAANVSLNTPVAGLISNSRDQDWFVFRNTTAQPKIQISLTNLPADYDIRLYRGSIRVASSERIGTANELITYNTSSVATYYLQIYGYRGANNPNDCYELKISLGSSNFRQDAPMEESVKQEEEAIGISISPNPASTELNIDVPITDEVSTQIAVFDMAGKLILQKTDALSKGNSLTRLDVSQLPNGIYLLRVQNGDYIANQKFVISR